MHAVFQPTHLYVQDGGGKSVHGHSEGSRHEGAGESGEVKGGGDAEAGGGAGTGGGAGNSGAGSSPEP